MYQRYIKRFLDILISLSAIIFLWPVYLILFILVRIKLGSPVLFCQKRPGYKGEIFDMYKFRSLTDERDEKGELLPDEVRLTSFGKKLRSTSLDELPELFNILKGDMSVVGPRCEMVENVEKYTKEIPEFNYRHKVKAGLTGYAQVYGKYNTTAYDKLKLDLYYIENYSLRTDLRIILMTIKILFMRESTEEFTEEKK
jgi:lipopolysaccharide/colanic/teichoic acid biosynthesis glycosyltransferase